MLKRLLRGASRSSPKVISQPQSVYDAVPRSTVSLLVMLDPKQTYSTTMQFEWQYCSTRACSNSTEKNEIWAKVESGGKDRITGVDKSTLLISEVRENDRGSYRCQITNSHGVTLTRPAAVTVVIPPQIEAQPSDVVDVVTGTTALFTVSINCDQHTSLPVVPNGGVVTGRRRGEREEGREGESGFRGDKGVMEGLQITWEFLRANVTTENGIVDTATTSPETPHERIFREHHPDLRHYLNTSSIIPYLSRHSLITSEQLEELTLPVHTNTRKVDLLLNWLPRATADFLGIFILCLNEANDHLAHAELASKLQLAMERARSGSLLSEASPPISPLTSSLTSPTSPLGCGQIVMEGGWEIVKEEEGKVEGTTTPNLHLLNVDESQEGQYQCRVVYKGCTILSTAARLTILKDEEIVRRLLDECLRAEETRTDSVIAQFLEKYGASSRLAKKALITLLESDDDLTNLIQSFTSRQVPVNYIHNGMSPLHYACVKGHWRTVQHLLSCGASKTALTQDGRNAVHLVCMRGDNNSLQFLLHTGADKLVNVQDKYGKTPLHLACELAQNILPSKLISQDMRDIKTVIQNLVKLESSLTTCDQNGQTPLHLAAKAGHQWIVEVFLLCNMTVIDIQDTINKETALHIASTMNWGEVVISLIERGANEMLENKDNLTPLALAESKGHRGVADILLRKPGTIKRDRKHTVYVTDDGRRRSAILSPNNHQPHKLGPKSESMEDKKRRSHSRL